MNLECTTQAALHRAPLTLKVDQPLVTEFEGTPSPSCVDQPGNPIGELEQALLAPFDQSPKDFLSQHRGYLFLEP